jgi:hypothetical protein
MRDWGGGITFNVLLASRNAKLKLIIQAAK